MGGTVQPFLKWAGGKRWLARSAELRIPDSYNRFIEPFLGSGAIFFAIQPRRAVLSDINRELIELYEVVRDEPEVLRTLLAQHQDKHCPEHYYAVRSSAYPDKTSRAARTLYLNRTCWNGLYRLNRKGQFNVPIGTKTGILLEENFRGAAELLANTDLRCCDFERTLDDATAGDFVFADPPYTVKHNMNGFIKYNEAIFSWDDQVRLRDACLRAASRGAHVVVTNADHRSLRQLYDGVADYRCLNRISVLAGQSAYRGETSEAMFVISAR